MGYQGNRRDNTCMCLTEIQVKPQKRIKQIITYHGKINKILMENRFVRFVTDSSYGIAKISNANDNIKAIGPIKLRKSAKYHTH